MQARITETVIGAMNPKAGCGGSILNILEMQEFNHQVIVRRGILEEECAAILKNFFEELRVKNKIEKQLRREQRIVDLAEDADGERSDDKAGNP